QPDNAFVAAALAVVYAILDEKGSALNEAQRAITLVPSSKDRLSGPGFEENLALVEMIIGENSRAISALTRLLHTPYGGWIYSPAPITPAILNLDPLWKETLLPSSYLVATVMTEPSFRNTDLALCCNDAGRCQYLAVRSRKEGASQVKPYIKIR